MAGNIRKIKEMPAIPEDSEGIVIRKDSPSVIHKITKIEIVTKDESSEHIVEKKAYYI
ncbi:Uncharacterised protein [Clostridioides difficile]|nr:Uncharacterised protein [Clostridioides difficile]